MRAVILQPMYIPWMGYFGLIDLADVFVFYDDVQFVERSWQRRNKIKMPNDNWIWLSVPVTSKFGQRINEIRINNDISWAQKHLKSLKHAYGKSPFFKDYIPIFEIVYNMEWTHLIELDVFLIKKIVELLGLHNPDFIFSSELKADGNKTDRLINILNKIGADEYVSGLAAEDYIEIEKFRQEQINLYWYKFNHPAYPQLYGDFSPYMSVLDLLFNTGENAMTYITKGLKDALIPEGKAQ